jgi:hypothetical protein
VRKLFVIELFPKITERIHAFLQTAPELVRFVSPPTGIEEVRNRELFIHELNFVRIRDWSEEELKTELTAALNFEQKLSEPFSQAKAQSGTLYGATLLDWIETIGIGGRHVAFTNILQNLELDM